MQAIKRMCRGNALFPKKVQDAGLSQVSAGFILMESTLVFTHN